MLKIDSEVILMCLLSLPKIKYCTVNDLISFKYKIEEKFPEVYVDVTRNNVYNAVFHHPCLFFYSKDKYYKNKDTAKEAFSNPSVFKFVLSAIPYSFSDKTRHSFAKGIISVIQKLHKRKLVIEKM